MFVVWVTVKVKPGMGEQFVAEAKKNREGTRQEPGNLRFDILRANTDAEPGEPELFYLLEAYKSPEDFAAHQQTPHYFAFRDNVADLMTEPRAGIRAVPVDADPM
ncbi:MAG: (4S)-4-hydroxy-5-phosphonooxypentane-2,3-dione isomerase [Armatimonadaceae bacterium]